MSRICRENCKTNGFEGDRSSNKYLITRFSARFFVLFFTFAHFYIYISTCNICNVTSLVLQGSEGMSRKIPQVTIRGEFSSFFSYNVIFLEKMVHNNWLRTIALYE